MEMRVRSTGTRAANQRCRGMLGQPQKGAAKHSQQHPRPPEPARSCTPEDAVRLVVVQAGGIGTCAMGGGGRGCPPGGCCLAVPARLPPVTRLGPQRNPAPTCQQPALDDPVAPGRGATVVWAGDGWQRRQAVWRPGCLAARSGGCGVGGGDHGGPRRACRRCVCVGEGV